MARPLRIQVPHGFFHVTSRGNGRRAIYLDDADRRAWLLLLRHNVVRFGWRCISYCQMGNHFHLLLQTPKPNLADGMRDLNSGYAQRFFREHGGDGSLFKPRYWSQLVEDRDYLVAAARYIALNPVRAGLVSCPADWPWSAHAGLISGNGHDFVDPSPLFDTLDPDRNSARARYAEVVADGSVLPDFEPNAAIFGSDEFIRLHAPVERPADGISKLAWNQARPALGVLSATLARDEFIWQARGFRYTIREIAATLGCSTETVRRRLRALEARK